VINPDRAYGPRDLRQERHRRLVHSESELRSALHQLAGNAPVGSGALSHPLSGCEITIAALFNASAPFEIPPNCAGLAITSLGFLPIKPTVRIAQLFLVNAHHVRISGVALQRKSATVYADAFVEIGSEANAGLGLVVERCFATSDRFYVDAAGADNVKLTHNEQAAATGGPGLSVVQIGGDKARVIGNIFTDGGGDTVNIGAGGISCAIIGNYFDSGDYTSTASGGGNTLIGNNSVGAVTAHATDRWRDSGLQSLNA